MGIDPKLPDLDGLDDASCIHDAIVGAAGVLAERLRHLEEGSDIIHAAYAIGHLAKYAQETMGKVHQALMQARQS